ncbi:MAG: OmpH family outer membrane protein [Robiginitomaculum sp.]|nr:OmpH family outer membrane protein [Robiginitomaculum sp.]
MKTPKFILSMAIGLFATLTLVNTAMAQSTILVVDQSRVLRDSDVGKHIKRQIESIGKQMEAEMKAQVSPIAGERTRLMTELKDMNVEALKSRPDLQKRAASLQEKTQKSQLEVKYKQTELQITEQKALAKINEKLAAIMKAIVDEKRADVVLDRSMVIYTGPSTDITDAVISRLNSQMKTVTVVRERLPRKPLPKAQPTQGR